MMVYLQKESGGYEGRPARNPGLVILAGVTKVPEQVRGPKVGGGRAGVVVGNLGIKKLNYLPSQMVSKLGLTNRWRSQIDPPYHKEGKMYYRENCWFLNNFA